MIKDAVRSPAGFFVAVLALGALSFGAGRVYREAATPTPPEMMLPIGAKLPESTVLDVAGNSVRLHEKVDLGATNVVLLVSTRCNGCAGEARAWEKLAAQYADLDFVVLASTTDRTFVRPFLDGEFALPFFYSLDESLFDQYSAPTSPTIHVIDPAFGVVFRSTGYLATSQLEDWLRAIVGPRGVE